MHQTRNRRYEVQHKCPAKKKKPHQKPFVRIVFDAASPQSPSIESDSPRKRGWFSERTPLTYGLLSPAFDFHFSVTGQVRKFAAFAQPHSSAWLEQLPASFPVDRERGVRGEPFAVIRLSEDHSWRWWIHCCLRLMTYVQSFPSFDCSLDVQVPFGNQNHSQVPYRAVRFLNKHLCACVSGDHRLPPPVGTCGLGRWAVNVSVR